MAKHIIIGVIHFENGVFGVSFPDFPGCVSGGTTQDEAGAKGEQALSFHVASMIEDGDPLPRIRPLAEIMSLCRSDLKKGAALIAYNIDIAGKAQRINLSIEEGLLAQVDRDAAARGETRSAYLAEAARKRLRETA